MREAYVEINGVRTKISTWGRWIEEAKKDDEPNEMVLIIPGNPGVNGFYHLFAKTIHELTGFPVWIVGHAGHNIPNKSDIHLPKFKENKDLYGLKGQIEHKIALIRKFIPEISKVHIIGHSIGAHIAIEMMEHSDVQSKVEKNYLLFPTVEHMAITDNGKMLNRFFLPLSGLLIFLSWVFTYLPRMFITFLVWIYTLINGVPFQLHCDNLVNLVLSPSALKRIFFLAAEELEQVRDRNDNVIRRNGKKIKWYYGRTDPWTSMKFCETLKQIDGVDLDVTDINHSFVLNYSEPVADYIVKQICSVN